MDLYALLDNHLIVNSLAAWAAAQIIKTILYAVMHGKLDFHRLFGDGGSEHAQCTSTRVLGTELGNGVGVHVESCPYLSSDDRDEDQSFGFGCERLANFAKCRSPTDGDLRPVEEMSSHVLGAGHANRPLDCCVGAIHGITDDKNDAFVALRQFPFEIRVVTAVVNADLDNAIHPRLL